MEGNVYLTRLVPIERKLIITRIYPKYLLAGKAIYGDCSKERNVTAERLVLIVTWACDN